MRENETIIETLRFLAKGNYSERKQYMKDFMHDGVTLNGYTFQSETWCYLVWKPTDFWEEPQYKGESLCKVIPQNVRFEDMEAVLDAQAWMYV